MAQPKAVLVLSGKGGVGKTLVSVNLVLLLNEKKVKVGLLDADFSASNSGYFLDFPQKQMNMLGEQFQPIEYEGIEVFSAPFILGESSVSMIGDQYSQLLRDAVYATAWKTEYIIVDCPAGFGDELITAAKVFADSLLGSVIVLQPAHELDARRALQLHKDLELPILGLIENMSYFKGGVVKYDIFGESVVDKLGKEFDVPVFGKIPLSMDIRKQVAEKKPKLTGEYAEPITNAVNAILKAKPHKPGFLSKIKIWFKEQLDKLIIAMALSINSEISIPDLQQRFGYPGGSIIRLNIMNDTMDEEICQVDWIVNEGKLTAADGNYTVDAQIDITPQAIKWAILGNKILSHGYPYTFQDALRLGHMRIYGDRSMARGAYFMQKVFTELSQNQKAMERIRPILEVL